MSAPEGETKTIDISSIASVLKGIQGTEDAYNFDIPTEQLRSDEARSLRRLVVEKADVIKGNLQRTVALLKAKGIKFPEEDVVVKREDLWSAEPKTARILQMYENPDSPRYKPVFFIPSPRYLTDVGKLLLYVPFGVYDTPLHNRDGYLDLMNSKEATPFEYIQHAPNVYQNLARFIKESVPQLDQTR